MSTFMTDNNVLPLRSKPFGPAKVIKKTTGLYKSKRFHFQLFFFFSFSIVSLIFGIIHVHNCPIQSRIPVYLIVQGAVGLLIFIIHLFAFVYILWITKYKYFFIGFVAFLTAFLGLFLFIWFIVGNVWVFKVVNRVQFTDPMMTTSYCSRTLYHAAFWLIIVQYIMAVFYFCSFIFIRQSAYSPTNGIIKIRKQIPKVKRMITTKSFQPSVTPDIINIRL